jgi:hypothetical protein
MAPTATCAAVLVAVISSVFVIPNQLKARDEAVLIANPKPPIPSYGKVITITHDGERISRFARFKAAFPHTF